MQDLGLEVKRREEVKSAAINQDQETAQVRERKKNGKRMSSRKEMDLARMHRQVDLASRSTSEQIRKRRNHCDKGIPSFERSSSCSLWIKNESLRKNKDNNRGQGELPVLPEEAEGEEPRQATLMQRVSTSSAPPSNSSGKQS